MNASSTEHKVLRFSVASDYLRKIEVERGVTIYHIYPTTTSWIGREAPDDVNPRSHEDKALSGNVPQAIRQTLIDNPEDFYLANRGLTLLVDRFSYDPAKQIVEITLSNFTGDDAEHGIADGGTTDAVIAEVQNEVPRDNDFAAFKYLTSEQIPHYLKSARVHIEVIVGLSNRDRIKNLVQGRNTSKQVKSWSITNFKGKFNWIKEVLDADNSPFKGKIGYEENAVASVTILEVLAIMTLFHQRYNEAGQVPTIAYSSKGRMDTKLADEALSPGYKALAPILCDILSLHDYVYSLFVDNYTKSRPGGKLGRWGSKDDRIFIKITKKLPLTGEDAPYVIPSGVLYPLLASMRALIGYDGRGEAYWLTNPQQFFDKYGSGLLDSLFDNLELTDNNPQTLGKKKPAYNALYDRAQNYLLRDQLEAGKAI